MKPKFRRVLETALEEGVRLGYNRAHKHVEKPSENAIIDTVVENDILCLDEWFDFEDDYNGN
jgi:hypothetical protein